MRYRLGLLLIGLCATAAQGQSPIEQLIEKGVAWEQVQNQADSAAACYTEAYRLATQQGVDSLAIDAKRLKANLYGKFGDFARSSDSLRLLIAEAEQRLGPGHHLVGSIYVSLGVSYGERNMGREELAAYRRAEAIYAQSLPPSHPHWGDLYNEMGIHFQYAGDRIRQLDCFKRSLDNRRLHPEERYKLAQAYNNYAVALGANRKYQQQLDMYAQVEAIWSALLPEGHPDLARLANNQGAAHLRLGDYQLAIDYLQKAKNIFDLQGAQRDLVNVYRVLGKSYYALEAHDLALAYYEDAEALATQLGAPPQIVGYIYRDQAAVLSALQHYEASTTLLYQSLTPPLTQNMADSAFALRLISENYRQKGEWLMAERIAKAALDACGRAFGPMHPQNAPMYEELAELEEVRGDFRAALAYWHQALRCISNDFQEADPLRNPSLALLEHNRESTYALEGKIVAAYRFYEQGKDPAYLDFAQQSVLLADSLAQILLDGYATEVSKQFLAKRSRRIYEIGLHTAYEQYARSGDAAQLALAFGFFEKSKNGLLRGELERQERAGLLPAALAAEARRIKEERYLIKAALYAEGEPSLRDSLENALFALQKEEEAWTRQVRAQHPDYFRRRALGKVPDWQAIRRQLPADGALLQYFMGDNALFALKISRQDLAFERMALDSALLADLATLRRQLGDYGAYLADREGSSAAMAAAAHRLYGRLLRPLFGEGALPARLFVVPDAELAYLPFDALLSAPAQGQDFRQWPYVLRQSAVSYAFSAGFLRQPRQATGRQAPFAGFAADYDAALMAQDSSAEQATLAMVLREGELALPGAAEEVAAIAQMMGGQSFRGREASERQFKALGPGFRVLHLSMHALPNAQQPLFSQLLFSSVPDSSEDNRLTVGELMQMRLPAELAVLSACNTGSGTLEKGEGVMSLSRGFAYAGCPSTVMSLWQISDRETPVLMRAFYGGLLAGLPKDLALRQAKLDWLAQASAPEQGHPFFWAGFVPNGDMAALGGDAAPWWFWALGAAGLLAVLLALAQREPKPFS